jgi:hypothetical protein
MNWFRAKIRQGSLFALLALTINLALSFGHIHLEDFRGGQASIGLLFSALSHHENRQNENRQSDRHDGHPDDLCPICMAQATLGSGLAAIAPVLPIDLAYVTLDPVFGSESAIPQRPRAGFRSRGPPAFPDIAASRNI